MLKGRLKKVLVFVCATMLAMGSIGTGNSAFASSKEDVKGRLLVNAGPDIAISYDKNGKVLEIKGTDQDGKKFLEGQDGYVGKSSREAMRKLVRRLDEKGWFDDTAKTPGHSLIVKSERGSEYPDDKFMEEIENEIRDVVKKRNIDIYIRVIDTQALDNKGYIDKKTAEKIVLELFGLKADSLKFKEYELDDGVYEIDVMIQGVKHEVKLNAVTGEVLEYSRENDRDDDDRYDDDRDDDDRYDDDGDDDDGDDDDRYDDDRYDDDHHDKDDDDDRDDD